LPKRDFAVESALSVFDRHFFGRAIGDCRDHRSQRHDACRQAGTGRGWHSSAKTCRD
jgi:hypothetical protein